MDISDGNEVLCLNKTKRRTPNGTGKRAIYCRLSQDDGSAGGVREHPDAEDIVDSVL